MTNTQLWKFCDRHIGVHLRKRLHSETGVAMVMALLYTVMFILTLSIVTSVLVAQAIPFKQNKSTQQAYYAAETGLQAGLSFLREASAVSKNNTQANKAEDFTPLFPSDGGISTYSGLDVTNTANSTFQTHGGAVILNNVQLDGSAYAAGDVTDYTSHNVSYRVEITYWNADPTNTSNPDLKQLTSAADITALGNGAKKTDSAKTTGTDADTGIPVEVTTTTSSVDVSAFSVYALITAKGYVDRYTGGTIPDDSAPKTLPMATLQGMYQFSMSAGTWTKTSTFGSKTVSVGSSDGAFKFQDNETQAANHAWVQVDTSRVWKEVTCKDGTKKAVAGPDTEIPASIADKVQKSKDAGTFNCTTHGGIDQTGDVLAFIGKYQNYFAGSGGDNTPYHEQNWIDDPANDLCMSAVTSPSGPSATSTPGEGALIRLYKQATSDSTVFDSGADVSFSYSDECLANGPYAVGSKWMYTEGDTIRLAKTDLCVTGADPSDPVHRADGKSKGERATLETCGTEYTPNELITKTLSDNETGSGNAGYSGKIYRQHAYQDASGNWQYEYAYDQTTESKPGSALMKYQKWDFVYMFINAGYWNSKTNKFIDGSYKDSNAGGDAHHSGAAAGDLYFEILSPSRNEHDGNECGNNVDNAGQVTNCYLLASAWAGNSVGVSKAGDSFQNGSGLANERTFNFSLNHGGQAGWSTNQVVSTTGACMDVRDNMSFWNTSNVVTKQCLVDAEPLNGWCYQHFLKGQKDSGTYWTKACGADTDNNIKKYDYVTYERPMEGGTMTDRDDHAKQGPVDLTAKAYQTKLRTVSSALTLTSETAGGMLQKSGSGTQFWRIEDVGNDRFNYKFVVASSVSATSADDFANDTAAVSGALCLQEETTGMSSNYLTRVNGKGGDSEGDNRSSFIWGYVDVQPCTADDGQDIFGRSTSTPQKWNAPTSGQGKLTAATVTVSKDSVPSFSYTSSTTSTGSTSFSSTRQFNLETMCTATSSDPTSQLGTSCWLE